MKKGTFIDFAVIMAARSHRKNKNLAVTEQKSKRAMEISHSVSNLKKQDTRKIAAYPKELVA